MIITLEDLAHEDRIRELERGQAKRNGQRRTRSLKDRNSSRRKDY